jgi:hypothetical protein
MIKVCTLNTYRYIADGVDRPRNAYSKLLRKLDARQFAAAGFGVVKGRNLPLEDQECGTCTARWTGGSTVDQQGFISWNAGVNLLFTVLRCTALCFCTRCMRVFV